MNLEFRNRLGGRESAHPQGTVLLGQYQIFTGEVVTLNSQGVQSGDFLIPDPGGKWSLALDGGTELCSGQFTADQFPLERERDGLLALGGYLQEAQPTWEAWSAVSPFAPKVDDIARMQPLDEAIDEYLHHLQEVCRHPILYLTQEVERLPVSRARRIPPLATEYLAAHPEDWHYRKLQSVVPKRILALIADDEVDIYENRVAARLF